MKTTDRDDLRRAAEDGAAWRTLPTRNKRQGNKGPQSINALSPVFGPFVAGEWVILSVIGDNFYVVADSDPTIAATTTDEELPEDVHDFVVPNDVQDPSRVFVSIRGVNSVAAVASVWSNGMAVNTKRR